MMSSLIPLQGELQSQIMAVLWRMGEGTTEQVRDALPRRHQGAYTTIQTVLNRLSDRGLLSRTRVGREIVYRPKLSESQYLVRAMEHTLSGATSDARASAITALVGRLSPGEIDGIADLAARIEAQRRESGS